MKMPEIPGAMVTIGYSPESCVIGSHEVRFGDDFMMACEGALFRVCDLDRNVVTNICLETESETEACQYFLRAIAARSRHLVTSNDRGEIERLQAKLEEAGLTIWRNDIATLPGPEFPQYRMFVSGADYLAAKNILASS